MDNPTFAVIVIVALVILAIVIAWYGRKNTGRISLKWNPFKGDVEVEAETQEETPRPEQIQIRTEDSEQEMPANSTGKQFQKCTKRSKQKMT